MDIVIRTVGHSNRPLAAFLEILDAHEVESVVDVRSVPWSRRWPWYRKPALAAALAAHHIAYRHLGDALGGKSRRPCPAGDASFDDAITRVLDMARNTRVAIMCAEADPARCHRAGLLAPAFLARGARVEHLLSAQRSEEHARTQDRMAPERPVNRDLFEA